MKRRKRICVENVKNIFLKLQMISLNHYLLRYYYLRDSFFFDLVSCSFSSKSLHAVLYFVSSFTKSVLVDLRLM